MKWRATPDDVKLFVITPEVAYENPTRIIDRIVVAHCEEDTAP